MNVLSEKVHVVFDTTLRLIAEHGLHNTPMSLVSKQSGISTGAIYHYFESKETLINELYLYVKEEIMNKVFEDMSADSQYKENYFLIWNNYFEYLINNPTVLSFVEQCSIAPIIKEETRKKAEQFIAPLIQFITKGIQKGVLRDTDIHLILAYLNGSVVITAKLHISKQLIINKKMKHMAIETSWRGLAN